MKIKILIMIFTCLMLTACELTDNPNEQNKTEAQVTPANSVKENYKNENKGSTDIATPTQEPTQAPEPLPTDAPIVYLKEDEIPYLYTNVNKYIGKYVNISGKIFMEPEKEEGAIYFQMFQNSVDSENNTVVAYYNDLDVKDGDYVIIDGMVYDEFEGQNAFGGTVTAPMILATNVQISTYQEVTSPSIKTLKIDEKQEQYGYEIVFEKVEFAKDETRLYITVTNNGNSNFSAYTFNMKLIQNKKQYEEQSNYDADYPEVQTDLYPDTSTSGIVCFPAISQTDSFSLYIDGSSDDWDEEIEQYKFNVDVQ